VKRKLASYRFNIAGMEKLPEIEFRKPTSPQITKTRALLKKLFVEKKIVVNKVRCARCEICMKHCPGKAISMPFYPEIDRKKCIRCFCCIEICPQHALSLKQ
jgi:ferredoxin